MKISKLDKVRYAKYAVSKLMEMDIDNEEIFEIYTKRFTKDFKKFMQNLDIILISLNIEHKDFFKYASYDPDLDYNDYFDDIDVHLYCSYPNAMRQINNEEQSKKLQDLADLIF